jgi:hypothetical protein
LSSAVFPSFVVITAWVTLLYVVSPAIALAATSIGRIGLESLALGQMARVRLGSKAAENKVTNFCPLYPQQQSFRLWSMNGRFVPGTDIQGVGHITLRFDFIADVFGHQVTCFF